MILYKKIHSRDTIGVCAWLIVCFRLDRQIKTLAEPRDNVDIFPPKGNLHKSSYRRLGPEEDAVGISETRAMLSQIELLDEYKAIPYPRRSLLTMQSLACAEYVNPLLGKKSTEKYRRTRSRTVGEVDGNLSRENDFSLSSVKASHFFIAFLVVLHLISRPHIRVSSFDRTKKFNRTSVFRRKSSRAFGSIDD